MSIEVCAGTFAYRGQKPVLQDVSFSVQRGRTLAILGPNGVGKTTLIKCMLGFLPWQSGETRIDGKPLRAYRGRQLWQRVAYVPQARKPAFAYAVQDMVLLGRSPYLGDFATPGSRDREIARQAMEQAGIAHLAGKRCDELSGGELQLVLIARALAAQPRCLVLDEPESGLDLRNQLVVLELISRLCRDQDLTVILNTHYPDHALRVSDEVLLLFPSGATLCGRTQQLLTEDHMQALFGVDIAVLHGQREQRDYSAVIPLEILKSEEREPWTRA